MYYPPIPDVNTLITSVKLIQRQLQDDPKFLDHDGCPYPNEFIELVRSTLHSNVIPDNIEEVQNSEYDDGAEIDIAAEATNLFKEMKTFKADLTKGDVTEKAAMFRTLTSLMEKLINIKERASSVKHYELFESLILETIDSYLSPQERTEFLDRIQEIKD